MTTTTTFTISENGTVFVRERDTDADGNVTRNHRSSYVPGSDISAQSQEVQDAAVAAWTPEVLAAYQASLPVPTPEELRANAKAARTEAVAAITVTTSTGKVFDGDEQSQERMARAILISQLTGLTSTTWTLADNAIVAVTLAELTEALILSGQQQAALWPIPE